MSDIIWQDPPPGNPRGRQGHDWPEKLRPLVDHPKRWALVHHFTYASGASQVAKKIREGHYPLVIGHWEAVGRPTDPKDKTKGSDLYVRYMGEES